MTPVPAMLIAPSKLEQAIERLPAEQRARLRWAPERFRRILDRLLVGQVTPEVIHQVTEEFVQVCVALARDLPSRTRLHEGLSEDVPDVDPSLHGLLTWFQGFPAAEGIEWTLGVLRKSREHARSGVDVSLQGSSMSLLKAQVILFALLRAAERGLSPKSLEELAETAYLEAAERVDLMAMQGIDLDPLSGLTPEQRFKKTLRCIDDLRGVLTPEDLDAISRARAASPLS